MTFGPNAAAGLCLLFVACVVFAREIGDFSQMNFRKALLVLAGMLGLMLVAFPHQA